ncbi:hypothetical protein LSAT2_020791 [Lamellibrachia satsuma]|nr:hypothetical protein LSAT2_020791 [Lamellibrachia satsuma]
MYTVSWWLVVGVVTLFIVESGSSPACEIPARHTDGEHVSGPREPKGGQICQRRGAVEIVTRQCETRYCCGSQCTCLGDVYENSTVCSGTRVEVSCFVEHKEIRGFENMCCRGYKQNSYGICVDIDECSPNRCDQGCRNFDGGFHCYCVYGYQLATDGHSCIADPTCNNRCDHQCALVRGTYRCTCRPHYVLGEDGRTCYPMTTCSVWNDCEQVCNDTEKGFECSCRSGYRLNLGYTCDDINECTENERVCDHECVNTNGSYRCYCDFGFLLNATDDRSCIEDATCSGLCDHGCALVLGLYRCVCREGYELADDHVNCRLTGTTSMETTKSTDIVSSVTYMDADATTVGRAIMQQGKGDGTTSSRDVMTSARFRSTKVTQAAISTSSKTSSVSRCVLLDHRHRRLGHTPSDKQKSHFNYFMGQAGCVMTAVLFNLIVDWIMTMTTEDDNRWTNEKNHTEMCHSLEDVD